MLKGKRSTTLNYSSVINDEIVVSLHANIPETGETSRNVNILNKSLYEANKEECRTDMEKFGKMVDEIEDSVSNTEVQP